MNQPGPPPDPDSEKRILLAFVLTFVVIALMQPLLSRYMKPAQPANGAQQTAPNAAPASSSAAPSTPPSTSSSTSSGALPPSQSAAAVSAAKAVAAAPVRQAASEQELVIENDLYKITFTNRGAQVKSWVLKKYDDDKGHPLELVHPIAAPQYGYPLSLWTWDATLRDKLNSVLYAVSTQAHIGIEAPQAEVRPKGVEAVSAHMGAPAAISFEFSDGSLSVRKLFSFDHTYVVRVETSVTVNGAPTPALIAWPAGFGDQTVLPSYAAAAIVYEHPQEPTLFSPGKTGIEREAAKKVSGGNTLRGPFHWAGVTDQYFAAVFLPDDPQSAALVTLRHAIKIPKNLDKPDPNEQVDVDVLGAAAGSLAGVTTGRMFVGPKAVDVLGEVHASGSGPNIEGLVDFGKWFGWAARPLFLWLRWTHEHWVANWGWSILILTVLITLAVTPLRVTSMKSALKMQRVQPEMNAIKERYKAKMRGLKIGDPKRQEFTGQQNAEMQAVMKKAGASPVGGCLPMLLQFPFLVAFYSMLGVAIELRHAPWLWIHDLSSPDPWHLLPILFVVTMVAAQQMTPQPGVDPMQQRMMTFMMPLMFGFMCWNLASGLALYWAASNMLGVGQQLWINNTKFGREMRAEMAKRAAKKQR